MRAPMVPAPRMATLLMRFIIELRYKSFTAHETPDQGPGRCSEHVMVVALGKFIHGPVVVAGVEHDDVGKAPLRFLQRTAEQDDGEFITSATQQFAMLDFVSAGSGIGKQALEFIALDFVLRTAGEQDRAGFYVFALPGLEEAVGGSERPNVVCAGGGLCRRRSGGRRQGRRVQNRER